MTILELNKVFKLAKNLFHINRSLTGNGVKKTLKLIKNEVKSIKIKSIRSGTKVFDWVIPPEWNISDAYVIDKNGKKIIDFKLHNLHAVGYSVPVKKKITRDNLLKKIYSLPKKANAIPYVTSYYKRDWGFCLNHKDKEIIRKNYDKNDIFFVRINSKLNKKGELNYGELLIKGREDKEILISTYICHPSMANNELSGPMLSLMLIKYFLKYKYKCKYSIRFLFIPETIGSIAYLSKNLCKIKTNFIAGFNLSCVGDERAYSIVKSKNNDSIAENILKKVIKRKKLKLINYSFLDRGSDERQYNSPGIDLPVVCFCRSKFGKYYEYHTSLDDFKVFTKKGLMGSYKVMLQALKDLMKLEIPISKTLCEPFMTKYNLYETLTINKNKNLTVNILNFLQYSDGKHCLEEISKKIKVNIKDCKKLLLFLKKKKLVK